MFLFCCPRRGRLHSARLVVVRFAFPPAVARFMPAAESYVLEQSVVDRDARTFTLNSTNLSTLRGLFAMDEECVYRPDPAAPHARTLYTQAVTGRCKVPLAGKRIEKALMDFNAENSKAAQGFMARRRVFARSRVFIICYSVHVACIMYRGVCSLALAYM